MTNMDTIETIKLTDDRELRIEYDEYNDDPRERGNLGKLCVRNHRRYNFPNELDVIDFDDEKELKAIRKKYWVFTLDFYEHSGIAFSLSGRGMQCMFDTARNCGFIAIPKQYNNYDCKVWSESKKQDQGKCVKMSEKEAEKSAESEINTYNQYLNGEVYRRSTYTPVEWTNSKGEKKIEMEYEDGCCGYYSIDDIKAEFLSLIQ